MYTHVHAHTMPAMVLYSVVWFLLNITVLSLTNVFLCTTDVLNDGFFFTRFDIKVAKRLTTPFVSIVDFDELVLFSHPK